MRTRYRRQLAVMPLAGILALLGIVAASSVSQAGSRFDLVITEWDALGGERDADVSHAVAPGPSLFDVMTGPIGPTPGPPLATAGSAGGVSAEAPGHTAGFDAEAVAMRAARSGPSPSGSAADPFLPTSQVAVAATPTAPTLDLRRPIDVPAPNAALGGAMLLLILAVLRRRRLREV